MRSRLIVYRSHRKLRQRTEISSVQVSFAEDYRDSSILPARSTIASVDVNMNAASRIYCMRPCVSEAELGARLRDRGNPGRSLLGRGRLTGGVNKVVIVSVH
jgi:hypothetical protein